MQAEEQSYKTYYFYVNYLNLILVLSIINFYAIIYYQLHLIHKLSLKLTCHLTNQKAYTTYSYRFYRFQS